VAPCLERANAKLTAVVDFPTPPLPDATQRMCFTFSNFFK
jgi:hypothetical protein